MTPGLMIALQLRPPKLYVDPKARGGPDLDLINDSLLACCWRWPLLPFMRLTGNTREKKSLLAKQRTCGENE